jgi:hypothetical protein
LCVTIADEQLALMDLHVREQLITIGRIHSQPGLKVVNTEQVGAQQGFDHFRRSD